MEHMIEIRDTTGGVSRRFPARQITPHLAIGFSHNKLDREAMKVYSIEGQKPAIPHRIASYDDALKIALWLEEIYGEYWEIHMHDEWKEISVPLVSQWSVPNGHRAYVLLNKLADKPIISFADIQHELR